ncbi:MAG: hypothetical protein BECKG1743F_GA0114225_101931 [Candidatus Kentron sp. G]|nr:MAG: hypothetical protein BECKG1743F_GA0114225_101931 [Candidatus Kentron sp. G]
MVLRPSNFEGRNNETLFTDVAVQYHCGQFFEHGVLLWGISRHKSRAVAVFNDPNCSQNNRLYRKCSGRLYRSTGCGPPRWISDND